MPEGLLDRERILELFAEVASTLEARDLGRTVLVVVGGSFMALQRLRGSTADVDTLTHIEASLRAVVEAVAERNDLRPDWLNDRAAGFAPAGLDVAGCETLFEHPHLVVLGPPADFVFLMKLQAARAVDYDDMRALWPRCSFSGAEEAVASFRLAYPHEEHDPHLVDFVARIAREAGTAPDL